MQRADDTTRTILLAAASTASPASTATVTIKTFSAAYSGYSDWVHALTDGAHKFPHLVGDKYIVLGGTDCVTGRFTSSILRGILLGVRQGEFGGYEGLLFEVVHADAGLHSAFAELFTEINHRCMKVIVCVPHSAPDPTNIPDSFRLMRSFLTNTAVDFVMPQLFILV